MGEDFRDDDGVVRPRQFHQSVWLQAACPRVSIPIKSFSDGSYCRISFAELPRLSSKMLCAAPVNYADCSRDSAPAAAIEPPACDSIRDLGRSVRHT